MKPTEEELQEVKKVAEKLVALSDDPEDIKVAKLFLGIIAMEYEQRARGIATPHHLTLDVVQAREELRERLEPFMCSYCAGKGVVYEQIASGATGGFKVDFPCEDCRGTGYVPVEGGEEDVS